MEYQRRFRNMLLAVLLVAFGSSAGSITAETRAASCEELEVYGGLFCNDGRLIIVCELGDGQCTIDCGQGAVPMPCIEPE